MLTADLLTAILALASLFLALGVTLVLWHLEVGR